MNAGSASVKVGIALWARTLVADVGGNDRRARGAFHLFAKRHHPRRARPFALTLRLGLLFRPLRASAIVLLPAIMFLIATLPVFSFAHFWELPTKLRRIIREIPKSAKRNSVTQTGRHVKMRRIMRFDIVLIRVIFTAILLAAGYVLHPVPGHRLISMGVAGIVAIAIIFFEMRIRRSSLKTLIGAAVGSILGIVGAYLIGSLIINQEATAVAAETKTFLTLALTFFMAYVGLMVGAAKATT